MKTRPFIFFPVAAALAGSLVADESAPGAQAPGATAPPAATSPPETRERRFIEITPNDQIPTVRAITPIDASNVFFLNHRGQVGVAKFSPGLSQIGWEFYSEVKLNALPSLALGPGYSVLAASPFELTQGFDTDRDVELDFFQALVREWTDRDLGVVITAGPVADPHGRVLFALSPHALKAGDAPKARLMAWIPSTGTLEPVTESELPIEGFALRRDGLLAARLSMPDYTDGFFLSLTELPAPASDQPAAAPVPMPFTLPSLIIPAELTQRDRPVQPAFFEEDGIDKLLLVCPVSRHLVEIVPQKAGGLWQGAILLRGLAPRPVHTVAEVAPGSLLGGGDEGFVPLADDPTVYRITRLALSAEGIALTFSQPVDRYEAVKPENYSIKAIALGGGESVVAIQPLVESDGRNLMLRGTLPGPGSVLRVACQNVPSETGGKPLSASVFYTLHAR